MRTGYLSFLCTVIILTSVVVIFGMNIQSKSSPDPVEPSPTPQEVVEGHLFVKE